MDKNTEISIFEGKGIRKHLDKDKELSEKIGQLKMDELSKSLKKMNATEADGWEYAKIKTCCPGDDWADGYNQAIEDVITVLEKDRQKI